MSFWRSGRAGYALVCALYLLSFPYHPNLRSPNELCRLWQSRSIVDSGTLDLNATLQQFGMVGDLSCTLTIDDGGGKTHFERCVGDPPTGPVLARKFYPSKAPLLSFLGVPIYWVLKQANLATELGQVFFSRLLVTIIPTLLMLVALRRFLSTYLPESLAEAMVVTYALGTMAFNYAEAFMSHQLTAVLLFGCFYSAWRTVRGEWKPVGYLAAGAFAGATVMCEYTGAMGVVAIAVYVVVAHWKQWKALLKPVALVVAGGIPFALGLMAYHQVCFGHPLVNPYKFLNDAAYQGWHVGGFLGIKWPDPRAFGLSFFSPLRGLFALSPVLLLSFAGVREVFRKERALGWLTLVTLLENAYFTSSFTYDSWGWTVGPRHMTAMLPFLALPAGALLAKWLAEKKTWAAVAAGLCLTSVLATGLVEGVNYVPDDVSTSLWALALPMLSDGFMPVSALALLISNPASGVVMLLLLLGAVAWLGFRLRSLGATPAVMLVVVLVHFGVLKLFTKENESDVQARHFLESVWLVPKGAKLSLSSQ